MALYFDAETTGLETASEFVAAVTRTGGTDTVWAETNSPPTPFSQDQYNKLARALVNHATGPIVTFNGAGFDFRLLAEHVDDLELKRKLVYTVVYNHVDIMMDFLCSTGYFASLDSFLKGTDLSAKIWSGDKSAELCLTSDAFFQKTIEYCRSDVAALEQLEHHVAAHACLWRTTKAGKKQSWTPFHDTKFRHVHECIKAWRTHPVDTSWMDTPGPTPDSCLGWVSSVLS
jgi:hypothetical protein